VDLVTHKHDSGADSNSGSALLSVSVSHRASLTLTVWSPSNDCWRAPTPDALTRLTRLNFGRVVLFYFS
jgi:hypothetical protein